MDIKLPASLSESEKTVCKKKVIEHQLTQQQLNDVVKTYDDKAQRNTVKKPIALFHHFIGCVKKGTLILPTEPTPAENHSICRTAFATLNDEQIDKVLKTFTHNETTGTIHNPTRLLLYFVNALKNNTLTVPDRHTHNDNTSCLV